LHDNFVTLLQAQIHLRKNNPIQCMLTSIKRCVDTNAAAGSIIPSPHKNGSQRVVRAVDPPAQSSFGKLVGLTAGHRQQVDAIK
ncbi:MAG: hypothetical protein ACK5Q5_07000, partial [Planctomycetaceae bacterium]